MSAEIKGADVVTLAISAVNAETAAALVAGRTYLVTSDVDCFFRMGPTGTDATTSDAPLWSKQYLEIAFDNTTDDFLNAITASGSGTLYLIPLS